MTTLASDDFLARRDECPRSYCRTPGVGVGLGVRVHKNFNLAYISWTTIDRAFKFYMYIPCDKATKIFDIVTLTFKFDLLLKNLNLGHSFVTRKGRAFIFHMYIPCDKASKWIPKILT